MKLERLHEHVITVFAILGALIFAMYCGKATGGGNVKTVEMIIGALIAIVLGMKLRARIWILIPIFSSFPKFQGMPLSLGNLCVLLVFGWYIVLQAVKIVRRKATFEVLDMILFANLIYLVSVFIRHPTGGDAMGSDRVGGSAYVETAIAFFAYLVLKRAEMSQGEARWLPGLLVAGAVLSTGIGQWLSSSLPSNDPGENAGGESAEGTRLFYLASIGQPLVTVLLSSFRPLTLLSPVYFLRFALLVAGMVCIFLSGFRNAILSVIIGFFLASYFQRKFTDIGRIAIVGPLLFAVAILGNGVLFTLPLVAQRALSFLPGKWDPAVLDSGAASVEWRQVMWKAMMTERKYLENPLLGDGFGYSRAQFIAMQRTGATAQDNFLVTGQVHSGPISTIRYVGYVGLVLYTLFLLCLALESFKLIRASWGTPYLPVSSFYGLQIIPMPLFFFLIYGNYDSQLPMTVLWAGMLGVIRNGLTDYKASLTNKKESANSRLRGNLPEKFRSEFELIDGNWIEAGASTAPSGFPASRGLR